MEAFMEIRFSERERFETRDAFLERKLREARELSTSSGHAVKVTGYFYNHDLLTLERLYGPVSSLQLSERRLGCRKATFYV